MAICIEGNAAIKENRKKLKLLIAEDETLVRQGIVALLEDEFDEIVEASDGSQAIKLLKEQAFDLALIDIGLPIRTGLDVMQEIKQRNLATKIIILTGDTYTHSPAEIYADGADAFLYKTADAEILLNTVTAVVKGRAMPQLDAAEGENAKSIAEIKSGLTARELQIIKLIAEGANNKQAADALFISEHTVRKHREHINRKLNVKSPTTLAVFAIKAGLV